MEDDPAAVGREVIGDVVLELLALEERPGVLGEVVEVLGHAGAPRVGGGVDPDLDLVDEVEEGLQEGSVEVLAPDLFAHLFIIN